jgi:hypothetical protein
MGRPLNKKYFANTNYQDFGTAGVGGESVASVPNATGLSGMTPGGPYTIDAADISAPQITGGEKPVLTFTATGATTGTITVVSAGSGYTAAPTAVVRGALAGGSGTTTKTAVLTSGASARQNGIKCETQYGSGDSEIVTGDIIKQVSTRRYKVQTSQGTGVFKLVTTEAKSAGEMSIMATDSDGGTYLVSKLTARHAVLVPTANTHGGSSSAGSQYASGAYAKWTFGSAAAASGLDVGTVTIQNQ